jgi:hypothetical protein
VILSISVAHERGQDRSKAGRMLCTRRVIASAGRISLGDPLLLGFDLHAQQVEKREILSEHRAIGLGQLQPPQVCKAFDSEEIATLGQRQVMLPIQ